MDVAVVPDLRTFISVLSTAAVIELCRSRSIPVAVGGRDVTSSPHVYARANFRVVGEAEPVIAQFVDALTSGAPTALIEAENYAADVATTPIPRFDLLNMEYYRYTGVQ
jgi:radical SAM superfamily enzyme YgiQ (UPF0313 family)